MPDVQLPASVDAPLIVHGDCIEVLRGLPAESVHVIVTDPPAGIGFMGKGWDSFADYQPQTPRGIEVALAFAGLLEPWARGFVVFLVDVWTECMRVLKPGGHVCAWALPKTADLAGLALRLAGFDTRDNLVHLFGQGMPHGLDISKAIDKAAGAEREVIGEQRGRTGLTVAKGWNTGPMGRGEVQVSITVPATDLSRAWADWNTQLAPGHEQWLLARKPSPLTYAATAVEHGTGCLNIGACRVPRGERPAREAIGGLARTTYDTGGQARGGSRSAGSTDLGGWPSNVLLSHSPDCAERCVDGCPVLELDRQAPNTGNNGNAAGTYASPINTYNMAGFTRHVPGGERDKGGASRFFPNFRYQAKAKRRDIPGRADLTIDHPTHKHPDLMRWLVRLLASPDAIVLDPFAGSGTTGVACVAEGFRFIGIELNPDSVEQARARLAAAVGSPNDAAAANTVAPVGAQLGLL